MKLFLCPINLQGPHGSSMYAVMRTVMVTCGTHSDIIFTALAIFYNGLWLQKVYGNGKVMFDHEYTRIVTTVCDH